LWIVVGPAAAAPSGGPMASTGEPGAGMEVGKERSAAPVESVGVRAEATVAPRPPGSNDEEAVRAAVSDLLERRREERRSRFIDGLVRRIEAELSRDLAPGERGSLAETNREYFAAVDLAGEEADETGRSAPARERVSAARRARIEAIGRILGSEERAGRLLAEATNAVGRNEATAAAR